MLTDNDINELIRTNIDYLREIGYTVKEPTEEELFLIHNAITDDIDESELDSFIIDLIFEYLNIKEHTM